MSTCSRWNQRPNASAAVVLPRPGSASSTAAGRTLSPSWRLLPQISSSASKTASTCGVRIGPRLACQAARAWS